MADLSRTIEFQLNTDHIETKLRIIAKHATACADELAAVDRRIEESAQEEDA